jgi:hypothetical protein
MGLKAGNDLHFLNSISKKSVYLKSQILIENQFHVFLRVIISILNEPVHVNINQIIRLSLLIYTFIFRINI